MDFACGKEATSKELLSRKIYGTKVKDSRDRTKYRVATHVDMPNFRSKRNKVCTSPFIDGRMFFRVFTFHFQL